MPPKKKARVSEPMTAPGAAPATVKSQGNYVRIANLFLAFIKEVSPELSAKWGESWDACCPQRHKDTRTLPYSVSHHLCDATGGVWADTSSSPQSGPDEPCMLCRAQWTRQHCTGSNTRVVDAGIS